ncbi:uncharacterized protein LOC141884532 isoform X2 [Acropora palmata]|uniref:uncharacterized protein LOC141884532 isoform X2 n=1 Tax=Acropora palmata TaxID=6131 RepID=UPI003DA16A95
MKLTRFSYSFKGLLLLICLGIQHGKSNAKAINKPKHGVNKSGSKKFNAPKGKFCKNHSYCVKYSDLDCASEWVQLNCPRMCRLCEYEGPNLLNLPAVLYYKKGDKKHGISGKTSHKTKHADKDKKIQRRSEDDGDRRDVVFLSKPYDYAPKPTTPMPTTSYTVFDYKGNYRNWLFLYPDQHPVNLRYVDQGKAKDSNQQTDQQQQSSDSQNAATAGAPVAAEAVAAPTVSPASLAAAQPAAPAFASPATAPGVGQPAMAAAQPWNGAQTAMTNQTQNKTIELINQSVSLASNETQQARFKPIVPSAQGYDAENSSVPAGNMDFSTTGQVATQDTTSSADAPAQTPWTCCRKVPPPKDCKPCPKLPKAPHMPYVFNIYCDDIYKDCAYAYSNCNDTWWEINCPKTCGLCKTKDKVSSPTAKEIMPKEVKNLVNAELQSDLVAPIPGEKPLVAKYTLRVKPKLINGVPQMQEIRIMPPNKSGVSAYVKPLMVLKQNITKPMIENIEIDVPKKGTKFSRKPSVEVIEGDHKETLQVHKGQAVVDDAMQRSNTKSEETQETKPKIEAKEDSPGQTLSPINTTTEQTAANYTTTEQTQSSSATAPYQGYTNQTPDAQTQSTTTTATADQSTASYQAYTQPQAASTASATEKTALSSTETCTDDNLCATYVESQCSEPWLVANCKSKCKLC